MIEDFLFHLIIRLKSLHCRPCIENLRPTLIYGPQARLTFVHYPPMPENPLQHGRPAQMAYGSKRYTHDTHNNTYMTHHFAVVLKILDKKKDLQPCRELYMFLSLCLQLNDKQSPQQSADFRFFPSTCP